MTQDEFLLEKGVPKIYLRARMSDAPKELDLDINQSYYFFSEGPGTGKTYLAWAILNEILITNYVNNLGGEIEFTTAGNLFLMFRETMQKSRNILFPKLNNHKGLKTEFDIIQYYSNADILALDDLGGMRPGESSSYNVSNLFEILNSRETETRQTIITSNCSLEKIANVFDDRIASRISALCKIINLTGADRRLASSKSHKNVSTNQNGISPEMPKIIYQESELSVWLDKFSKEKE